MGAIEFTVDQGRVRMYIDVDAVKRARLRLNSKLLGLKSVVEIVKNLPSGAGDPRRPG